MFLQKKKKQHGFQSQRTPKGTLDGSFRRNTVVISKSQRELSEHQQSVTQRQHDKKVLQRRRARKTRAVVVTGLLAALMLVLRLQLQTVTVQPAAGYVLVSPAADRYEAEIYAVVRDYTPAKQLWLLDADGLETALLKKYPEIISASFRHRAPLSTELEVRVSFRTPQFTWRDADKRMQFVDENGILFGVNRVRGLEPNQLVQIEDQSGAVLDSGSSVLTRPLVAFVGQLPREMRSVFPDKKNDIEQVIIPQSIREVHVRFKGTKYLVKLSSSREPAVQARELKDLLEFLKGRGVTPRSYIDLRTPMKAYYK